MTEKPPRCAHRAPATGRPACTRPAVYRVSRPSLRDSGQDTCRVHLAATLDALAGGDPSLMLAVEYVTEDSRA